MLYQKSKQEKTRALDETLRLNALRDLEILDTPPDEKFDRIVRVASQAAGTSIALLSLVDENRQWFKAKVGLDVCETERSVAFCHHSIQQHSPLIVPNAETDDRFASNPLVIGEPHIRFYAGFPLCLASGEVLGTLCVIDTQPRILSDVQIASLTDLAAIIVDELETRRSAMSRIRDTQDVQNAVQAIRETRNFYRSILDSCNEAIASYQPVHAEDGAICDFVLTDSNDAASSARGLSKQEMLGQRLLNLVPNLPPETFKRYVNVVETGTPIQFDDHYVDGHYDDWFRVSAARLSDGGLVISLSVITEQKKSQLRLKRSRDALDSFTAAVSHDLRTPLGHIAGFVELVSENLADQLDDQNKEFMGYVLDGVTQMRRLIDAMQKHARLGQMTIDRQSTDIGRVLGDVVRRCQADILSAGADLQIGEMPSIGADRLLLDQLFSNLLMNALRYRCPKRPLKITIKAEQTTKGIILYFADNGIGIAESIQEKVFNLFERGAISHDEGEGLGIGLAMCREIAKAHGGSIYLDPNAELGARFILQLPAGNALLEQTA